MKPKTLEEANYRRSRPEAVRRCGSCSYYKAGFWCSMFSAFVRQNYTCDQWAKRK